MDSWRIGRSEAVVTVACGVWAAVFLAAHADAALAAPAVALAVLPNRLAVAHRGLGRHRGARSRMGLGRAEGNR
ncbi:MAG: hypothetical protein GEU74_16335 [Nitriliruptorales bacterium]|nr:hypothetical protein [Nitriliruptorales bacterium]